VSISIKTDKEATAMRVQEMMSTHIESIEQTQSVLQAQAVMVQQSVHHLVVNNDHGKMVGFVSSEDIRVALAGGLGTHPVSQVMQHHILTTQPDETIQHAANRMRGNSIGALPVMEGDKLVGIITFSDMLELIGKGFDRGALYPERRDVRAVPAYQK